jgi:hypothetical protein
MEIPFSRAYELLRRFFAEFPYETNPGAIITHIHKTSGLANYSVPAPCEIILETAVGRARVCVWRVVWQGATRPHGRSLR